MDQSEEIVVEMCQKGSSSQASQNVKPVIFF
jgi:hypothetical protein